MVLNISGGLFGDNNKLTENREFFPISKQRHIKVIGDGQNAIGFMGHYAGYFVSEEDILGFAVNAELKNQASTTRNSTVVITNETQSTTLYSGNFDIPEGIMTNGSFFFSLEQINPGDEIRLTIGNQGVGTKPGAQIHGYYALEVNTITRGQDEQYTHI